MPRPRRAKVTAITDQQESVTNRSLGYDGLDRLTAANSPLVWGNAGFAYDPLDNLRSSVVGSRSTVLSYVDAGARRRSHRVSPVRPCTVSEPA